MSDNTHAVQPSKYDCDWMRRQLVFCHGALQSAKFILDRISPGTVSHNTIREASCLVNVALNNFKKVEESCTHDTPSLMLPKSTDYYEVKSRPPEKKGWYLAYNSNRHLWESKWWMLDEQAWMQVPFDRGDIYTHWMPQPDVPI
ncbi:MAG TPA: hypothetical protein VF077_13125 [Nitrospiraceae bacterium]